MSPWDWLYTIVIGTSASGAMRTPRGPSRGGCKGFCDILAREDVVVSVVIKVDTSYRRVRAGIWRVR
jgi:hypothetical protein